MFIDFHNSQDNLDMTHIGANPLSRLAMMLKPRYHFAGLHHTFYERTPYRLILFNVSVSLCVSYTYNICTID